MNAFANLKHDDSIQGEKDSLGGSYVLESDAYKGKITLAYVTTANSGAMGLVIHFKTEDDKDFRTTQWVTSGTAKGGHNYFVNQKGEKQYLPGYLMANSLALLTVGKELAELDMEEKVVNVYSPEAKKEVPTKVQVPVELIGKEAILGIIKQIVFKQTQASDGSYVDSQETREENDLVKVFRARDGMTTSEILAKTDEAVFIHQWKEKYQGFVKDKTKKAGASTAPASNKPTTKSLFA